eukprot:Gregarina_sp_Poly_1__9469@NODE_594_length_7275_cov_67_691593_g459_i0_p2_GENE_NODE_594_length_7275_cov_67_691593_g459_i0NODE_594_length_7275_cov_67_691593_g459_i0_p2_ORF_typecomplete_len453_score71_64Methyltransf_16/PF10294_9/2e25Ank_2/PF12796_7/2_4e13Ank_2/PF12796_7/3_6e08Ank_2/PF12796_7/2_1Ank_5/PF13857_6/0_00028Ank_5/PF13857_6/6_4e07Ank_5/PF13857_6/1_2e04Ank_4/PF13637_6/0_0056Ank_4/PF13637_6/2_3e06Ank/PF00023_30/0_00034Ank/PF00023_30/0_00039Ank/PF00023_30/7_3e02Ank_3/PF13606_6/0_0026Ank_3/PF13
MGSEEDWTLQHEFWYHCGCGDEQAITEIVSLVKAGQVPPGFETEIVPGKPFPYSVSSLVGFKDHDGSTPLHAAAANDHTNTVATLMDKYKAPWSLNSSGNSPLHWASQNGCANTVQWILANVPQADVLQQNSFGKSALSYGFDSQNDQVVTALLSHSSADALEKEGHCKSNNDTDAESSNKDDQFENITKFLIWPLASAANTEPKQCFPRDSSLFVKTRELLTTKDLQADVFNVESEIDQTGSFVWEASLLCALWMMKEIDRDNSWLANKAVIELGAGCGLPILSIGKRTSVMPKALQPRKLSATDFTDAAMNNLRYNIEFNNLQETVSVQRLNWLDRSTWPALEDLQIILGSDLIYDIFLVDGFIEFLHFALDKRRESQLFLTLERHRAGVENFRDRLKKEFSTSEIMVGDELREAALNMPQVENDDLLSTRFKDLETGCFYMFIVRGRMS